MAGEEGKTFTQDEVNGLIAAERRTVEAKFGEQITEKDTAIAALTKEKDTATGLATQADERLKTMEEELNSSKHTGLRYRVALDKGLPLPVAERLQGDDEEALVADADTLSELLKKPDAEGRLKAPPQGGDGGAADEEPDMNDLIRKGAGRG